MSLHFDYLYQDAESSVNVVTWADGTASEIADMLDAADAGTIDLSDYWSVGDERTVHLDAMTVGDAFTTAMDAQDVVLVLMDTGTQSGYVDVNDNPVNFVVGQKDCLNQYGRINTTNTTAGSWNSCAMRTDLNNKYYNALPTTFKACLKQFKTITATEGGASTVTASNDYIALFAEKEVSNSSSYCNTTEAAALVQIDYYKTSSANRIKKKASDNSNWWQRSPRPLFNHSFCYINISGTQTANTASTLNGIAPFMCI